MVPQELTRSDNRLARHYNYPESDVFAFDFGSPDTQLSVDVVDNTAIIIVGEASENNQYEFELPTGTVETTANNGILTIEVY